MGVLKEPIIIRRAGLASDGAGGYELTGSVEGIKLLATVTPRRGERTADGYRPYLTARYSFSGYAPTDLELQVGDVVEYRGKSFSLTAPPIWDERTRILTIDVEQLAQ